MKNIITFSAGVIFGIGLIIAGMTNPTKVISFLDLAGDWDPSLAFVMLGAISVAFFAFRKVKARPTTLLNEPISLPATTHISKALIIGSVLFGAGWALAGFCPGPAIVALGAGYQQALIFVIAMLVGMMAHTYIYAE